MPVGWNCTNSMLTSGAPAPIASAWPSPVYSHEFEVILKDLPMPPVAKMTAGASKVMKRPDSRQYPNAPEILMTIFEQFGDCAFHEDVDADRDCALLEGADHFESGAVADVSQPRIAVTAEVALGNLAFLGAVEKRTPALKLPDTVGRFLRM